MAGMNQEIHTMMTVEQARQTLRGVVGAIPTIFRASGRSVDLETTTSNVNWILNRGARQGNTMFIACGAAGEFPMMTTDERKQVIGAICQTVAFRVPIIASVQSNDIREMIELCQFCEEQGVVGVQIAGPYYYDGRPDDVVAWLEEVARHTDVGFLIYNHWYTGYNMPLNLMERLLDIPNTIGVKWSSPNITTFYDGIRRMLPRAVVIDNGLYPVVPHILGCRAFFSWLIPFYPELAWRVWDLLEEGRYAEAQGAFDAFMVPLNELFTRIDASTGGQGLLIKAAMAGMGLPTGVSRLPSRDAALTPDIQTGFRDLMERFDVRA
jgi:dihydrodipicolinate synthase/N-acetylneuraminate lyase